MKLWGHKTWYFELYVRKTLCWKRWWVIVECTYSVCVRGRLWNQCSIHLAFKYILLSGVWENQKSSHDFKMETGLKMKTIIHIFSSFRKPSSEEDICISSSFPAEQNKRILMFKKINLWYTVYVKKAIYEGGSWCLFATWKSSHSLPCTHTHRSNALWLHKSHTYVKIKVTPCLVTATRCSTELWCNYRVNVQSCTERIVTDDCV